MPVHLQRLSLDPALLLPQAATAAAPPLLLSDPAARLASLNLANGSFVYLSYPSDARSSQPLPPKGLSPAGSFGKKMTMDDLIARQIRITRQEAPLCAAASFDRDAANAFQLYVAEALAFAVKRAGFLYGRVDAETKEVFVDFIYEPPQHGAEDVVQLVRDADEEARVDAIAEGLGMRRVGLVFTQAVGRKASETGEYTMSTREVVQASELQAEGGIPEWVTAVVKLEVGDDGHDHRLPPRAPPLRALRLPRRQGARRPARQAGCGAGGAAPDGDDPAAQGGAGSRGGARHPRVPGPRPMLQIPVPTTTMTLAARPAGRRRVRCQGRSWPGGCRGRAAPRAATQRGGNRSRRVGNSGRGIAIAIGGATFTCWPRIHRPSTSWGSRAGRSRGRSS